MFNMFVKLLCQVMRWKRKQTMAMEYIYLPKSTKRMRNFKMQNKDMDQVDGSSQARTRSMLEEKKYIEQQSTLLFLIIRSNAKTLFSSCFFVFTNSATWNKVDPDGKWKGTKKKSPRIKSCSPTFAF